MKYKILNDRIDKMSNVLYFVAMELSTIGLMLPALIVTFFNFFIYGLSDESLHLPYSAM